ncbi:MAG: GspH/FimT family pseudopilin [Cellvibrionaceae bacterium]
MKSSRVSAHNLPLLDFRCRRNLHLSVKEASKRCGVASKAMITRGFTLPELMIVLLIASILLGIGIPSFQQMIKSNRLTAAANDIVGVVTYARSAAVQRGKPIHLGQRNGTDWTGGLVVYEDDGSNTWDAGEELRISEPLGAGVVVDPDNTAKNHFVFSGDGTVDDTQSFTLCDDRTGETGRLVAWLSSGIIHNTAVTCP